MAQTRRYALIAGLVLAAAYVVCGKLSLILALPPGYASPIFPPAGIAVAAAFIGGRRALPWVFLGSLLLNLWVGYSASQQFGVVPAAAALIIAAASMLQAAVGYWWLRRAICYPAALDNARDIWALVLSSPVICLVSATLSVGGLLALGIFDTAGLAMNWAAWWIGDTLGVVVMFPLVMVAAGEPRALWRSRFSRVAVPMLLTFSLFVLIFLRTNTLEREDSLVEFTQLSKRAASQIQTQFSDQESLLIQMKGMFSHAVDGAFTHQEFHRGMKETKARFPSVKALEFAPYVSHSRRAAFEAAERMNHPGFEIREQGASGQLRRAIDRDGYYPITYIEPHAGNEPALGLDIASTPKRRATLTRALEGGTVTASPPFFLVQERENPFGVVLQLAVKKGKGSGLVISVLKMDDFIGEALLFTRPWLYVRIVDIAEGANIYDNFAAGTNGVLFEREFYFGTRRYLLQTAPTGDYLLRHRGWQSWGVLVMGSLGSGLLGALLLLSTGYAATIERDVKERTRQLKESEGRFRDILEYAPIGMGVVSPDGRFMQVNQAFCNIIGYGKDEVERMTTHDITCSDDMEADREAKRRLLKGETKFLQIEKRYVHKDGRLVWVRLTASLQTDDAGKPLYLVGQVEDITERKAARDELMLHSRIISNMAEGVVLVRASDGTIVYANATYEDMFGYGPRELTGRHISIVNAPGVVTPREVTAGLIDAMHRNGVWSGEIKNIRKDGTEFWTYANVAAFNSPQYGDLWIATQMDITEQKLAEDKTSQLLSIIESTPDFIGLADAGDTHIIYINKAGRKRIGIGENDDVTTLKVADFHPAWAMQLLQSVGIPAAIRDGSWTGECAFLDPRDGSEIPVNMIVLAHRSPEGELEFFSTISHEITEQKKAEAFMRKSLKEKEALLKEVHHRVKNNLQIITSLLRLQSRSVKVRRKDDSRYHSVLKEAERRIGIMAILHEKLYKSSSLANIDFRDYVTDIINGIIATYKVGGGRIGFKIEIEEGDTDINKAVPVGLIVSELVSNAIKYAFPDNRNGEVGIMLRRVSDKTVELSVADNGVGLPEGLDIKNTGTLGLQLVTTLAEAQLKGALTVNSSAVGTEVKIRFDM